MVMLAPLVDTWYILYRGTWVSDLLVAGGDHAYISNKVTVKTTEEWAAMVAAAGSDAPLLESLGITEDLRDGI